MIPPLSIQLAKPILSQQQQKQQPIHVGCLPLKHNSSRETTRNDVSLQSNLVQHAFQWGCIARITSFDHSTANHSLKLSLIGIHRFKLTSFSNLQTPLQAQISSFPEIALEPSALLEQFKAAITRFILLLANAITPRQRAHDPKPQIDRLIDSLQPSQLSFLVDLMIRDIQLIPWQDKLEFLSYYNSQVKLEKFIQLLTRISDQIHIFNAQSDGAQISTTKSADSSSSSSLTPQQKELLIRSRLKAINSQLANGIEQLSQLYQSNNQSMFNHHPNDKSRPLRITYPRPRPFSRPIIIGGAPRRSSSGMFDQGSPFGEIDSEGDEHKELEKKIQSSGMSQEAFQICSKELKRLSSIQPSSVEHSVIKNYLEVMLELPWSKSTINLTNQALLAKGFLEKARAQLDIDHFGMLKVKQRLVEFLAVIKLRVDLETRAAANTQQTSSPNSSSSNQPPNESKISRLWKDTVDPTFLVEPSDNHLDRPTVDRSGLAGSPKETGKKPAPILLLVGPPGVGKTSVARSIAKALNKKFYRISLGGVKDESEIRGHRRTYVGSMPGSIVQALRRVGVNDPVILLDEIDKVGNRSINGDPASALLEVLDPEQNSTFVDHYINTPIDLSSVLFLATANSTSTISAPLLDRLETIQVDGYSLDEKINIASRNLIPKQMNNYSLLPHQFIVDDHQVLKKIILSYTNESGVRGLEREIGALCRAKVLELVQDREHKSDQDQAVQFKAKIDLEDVRRILGPEPYEMEVSDVKLKPGVAIGMAYQGSGNGSILYIEATSYPGKGLLKLTGSLGSVIKESAELALSWIKANASVMNVDPGKIDGTRDVHIHFPSGAVKKDGPSAGVALVVALVSLLSGLVVDNTVAVTGEISLRGQVLPVGGIREKVLAASRAGITQILIPAKNAKDVDADEGLRTLANKVSVRYVGSLYEVVRIVFKDQLWTAPASSSAEAPSALPHSLLGGGLRQPDLFNLRARAAGSFL
ncbi:hypothetical protein PtB15_11B229 [Puccinia triticina]|nr:hypothetical protein PtB15_11B229 [Puccinia triticina]